MTTKPAASLVGRKAPKGPPHIETIIVDALGRTDTGYELKIHLHGLHGIWHRLWAMVVLEKTLGGEDTAAGIIELRSQFEHQLGRPMTANEWDRLETHATAHAEAHFGS